jgi:heptosyltransferase III
VVRDRGIRRIILIQLMAIGDVLMCTPSIRRLRKEYPQAELTFLVSDYAYEALRYNPHLDKIIVFRRSLKFFGYAGFLLSLLKVSYDVLIDFQNNPRSYIFSLIIRSGRKITFLSSRRNLGYNVLRKEPPVEKYAALAKLELLKELGISEEDDYLPEMHFSASDLKAAESTLDKLNYTREQLIVTLSPVSKKRYKEWSAANYARLCDYLIERYRAQIVFTWGPGEREVIDEIISKMEQPVPEINYRIEGVLHLAALFSLADLHLGNDNGPRHFAISCGTPTVCIFGHIHETHWTPPGDSRQIMIKPHDRSSNPELPRITTIKFEEVLDGCDEILQISRS